LPPSPLALCRRAVLWPQGCDIVRVEHTPAIVSRLVRTGLATVEREAIEVDGSTMKFSRYHITDAGREALTR